MTQSNTVARTVQPPRHATPPKQSTSAFEVFFWPVLILLAVVGAWRRHVRRRNMTVDQRIAEDTLNELRRIRSKMR